MSLALFGLIAMACKAGLLIAAGALAAECLRRRPAASRHALWTAILGLALALPLAAPLSPPIPQLTIAWAAPTEQAAAANQVVGAATLTTVGWTLPALLMIVWLAGVAAVLAREVYAHIVLGRLARGATALCSDHWRGALASVAHLHPRLRSLRILESDEVTTPCTWGALRPVLLLPTSASAWSAAQRRDALAHELAHVQRFDYLSAFLCRLACAVHWYNPLVWVAAAETHNLREEACDDRVLLAGGRATDYAELLVMLASTRRAIGASVGIANGSPMRRRVTAILNAGALRNESRRVELLAILGVMTLGWLVLASVAPVARATASSAPLAQAPRHPNDHPPVVAFGPIKWAPRTVESAADLQDLADLQDTSGLFGAPASLSTAAGPAVPAAPAVPPAPVVPAAPSVSAASAVPAAPAVPATPAVPSLRAEPAQNVDVQPN